MKSNEVDGIKFENFYLSELSTVVSLYKKYHKKYDPESKEQVTAHLTCEFGLPLAVIFHTKKVVGYAAAIISSTNSLEMSYLFLPEFHQYQHQEALEIKAKRNFIQTFGDDDQSIPKLKSAIDRLIYWLNL